MASPAPTAAYQDALLALHAQQRARLSTLVQQTEAMLHSDWQRGMGAAASLYRPVLDEYAKALGALRIAEDDPAAKLSLDWLTSQNGKLASIEQSVRASALKYGNASVQTVKDAQLKAMNRGLQDAENLTQEALSPAFDAGVNPAMLFNRPNPDAISQMVGRAGNGHPLGDLFASFPQEATSGARQALLLGLATGANPVSMAQGISQALGVSRSRAITIARTEVLGSYRQAAHETYRANSDVLGYWMWSAGGSNPCAMCAGMDGTLHDLSEDLSDHPCGKCAPIPVTKPWSDILGPYGIDASDLEETSIGAPGNYTSISQKFDSYSPAKQREIIGTQTGYEAYKRGEVTLKDFIGVRPASDGFPSSYYQRSLKELQIPTRQASRLVQPSPEIMEKLRLGTLRYTDLGKITPDELMPAWAKASDASRVVYQILRNGLPYDMTSHESGLLVMNLTQMLEQTLPTNVRAAVERQLEAMGQRVERLTLKSTKLDATAAVRETEADIKADGATALRRDAEARLQALDASQKEYIDKLYALDHASPEFQRVRMLAQQQIDAIGKARRVFEKARNAEARAYAEINKLAGGRGVFVSYDKGVESALKSYFGEDIARADVASLAGAQEGDVVKVFIQNGDINLELHGKGYNLREDSGGIYEAKRRLGIDENGEKFIRNDNIDVFTPGKGIGTRIFADEVRGASDLGIPHIYTEAVGGDGYNGYYTWARLGYDAKLEPDIQTILPDEFRGAQTIQDLMHMPGGSAWWKANGETFYGTFDTHPGSLSMRVLNDYLTAHGLPAITADAADAADAAAVRETEADIKAALGREATHIAPGDVANFAAAQAGVEREMADELAVTVEHVAEREASTLSGADLRAEAERMRALVKPSDAYGEGYYTRMAGHLEPKAAILTDNPDWQKFVDSLGYKTIEQGGAIFTPDMQAVSLIEGSWSVTPLHGEPINVALRQTADEVFGLKTPIRAIDPATQRQADELLQEYSGAIRAYVQATYEQTQQWFADQGIDEIILYRGSASATAREGFAYDGKATLSEVVGTSISSYSSDPDHILTFAEGRMLDDYHALIATRVPASDVFGTPFTSMAHQSESEFLLLGRPEDAAILSWQGADAAPDITKALDELAAKLPATDADTLAGARAEVRDAKRAFTAAEDAVRQDYYRNPQGLLSSALERDGRVLRAQARLDAAQARVSELRQAARDVIRGKPSPRR